MVIKKRDGNMDDFQQNKITQAIRSAGERTAEFGEKEAERLSQEVTDKTNILNELTVESVQDLVESVLLDSKYKETAKSYILYREERNRARKPDIFKPRVNLKPFEYPQLAEYKDAIRHSYWLHSEFNYTSDIQDYNVNVNEMERNALKNSMLAIAQVEVQVKAFWGDVYKRMPKPEIADVGATFSESESRHSDAYAHLLEILGLNEEFEKIDDIPALKKRVQHLTNHNQYAKSNSDREYMLSVLLFSLFVEHVSLFSQFLIIMSFNKHRNLFKGMSNVIEATSKEEQIHGLFGIELINIVREEKPEWFDDEMEQLVMDSCRKAYESEKEVIDWIYEKGELDFLPKYTVQEFVKNRLNNSLVNIGYDRLFDVDEDEVEKTDWFLDELLSTKHVDFFVKRTINYTKKSSSITSDDLF